MAPDIDTTETQDCAEHVLVNITASYCSLEDRIRLRGKTQKNALVEVWITQRLACALVKHLLAQSGLSEAIEGFASEGGAKKTENTQGENPVNTHRDDAENRQGENLTDSAPTLSLLVREVDISRDAHACRLVFRHPLADATVSATLNADELASWMRALRQCFDFAGWQSESWRPAAASDDHHEHAPATIH